MKSWAYINRVSVGEGEAVTMLSCSENPGATSCARSAGGVSVTPRVSDGVLKSGTLSRKGVVMLNGVVLVQLVHSAPVPCNQTRIERSNQSSTPSVTFFINISRASFRNLLLFSE